MCPTEVRADVMDAYQGVTGAGDVVGLRGDLELRRGIPLGYLCLRQLMNDGAESGSPRSCYVHRFGYLCADSSVAHLPTTPEGRTVPHVGTTSRRLLYL